MYLWNVGIVPRYTASQPRRPRLQVVVTYYIIPAFSLRNWGHVLTSCQVCVWRFEHLSFRIRSRKCNPYSLTPSMRRFSAQRSSIWSGPSKFAVEWLALFHTLELPVRFSAQKQLFWVLRNFPQSLHISSVIVFETCLDQFLSRS